MSEEKLLFLSYEWLEKYKELLNANSEYEKAASNWEGDFIFLMNADGEILKEPVRAYMDLWHGKCRDTRPAAPGETADFTYSSDIENWKKLIAGKTGPIRGIVSRKFRLEGSITKVMRYMKAAQLLVSTATMVPTSWHDE